MRVAKYRFFGLLAWIWAFLVGWGFFSNWEDTAYHGVVVVLLAPYLVIAIAIGFVLIFQTKQMMETE